MTNGWPQPPGAGRARPWAQWNQRHRSDPIVTYALIALNVVVYLVTAFQSRDFVNNQLHSQLFADWQLVPVLVVYADEWQRIVGSGFLHLGPLHIALNMLAVWVLGRDLEIALGRWRYLAVYLVSLLGGSASVLWFQNIWTSTVGASGAVFGLLGALVVVLVRIRRSPSSAIAVIVLNLVISVTVPGISLFGHLGGLVAGSLAAVGVLYLPEWVKARTQRAVTGWSWAGIGLAAALTLGTIVWRIEQQRQQLPIV